MVIALYKGEIERARIFELLKPLNIMCVFVYRTVKMFLETGGVSGRPRVVRRPPELTEILSENKRSWLGKWILRREP